MSLSKSGGCYHVREIDSVVFFEYVFIYGRKYSSFNVKNISGIFFPKSELRQYYGESRLASTINKKKDPKRVLASGKAIKELKLKRNCSVNDSTMDTLIPKDSFFKYIEDIEKKLKKEEEKNKEKSKEIHNHNLLEESKEESEEESKEESEEESKEESEEEYSDNKNKENEEEFLCNEEVNEEFLKKVFMKETQEKERKNINESTNNEEKKKYKPKKRKRKNRRGKDNNKREKKRKKMLELVKKDLIKLLEDNNNSSKKILKIIVKLNKIDNNYKRDSTK